MLRSNYEYGIIAISSPPLSSQREFSNYQINLLFFSLQIGIFFFCCKRGKVHIHDEVVQKIMRTGRKRRMIYWEQLQGIVNGRAQDWHQCEGERKKKKGGFNKYCFSLWMWSPFMILSKPKERVWVIEITFGCGKLFSWLQSCSETKLCLAQVYNVTQACG